MEIKTINGNDLIVWETIDGKRWDTLGEQARDIVSYQGGWRLVERKEVIKDYFNSIV